MSVKYIDLRKQRHQEIIKDLNIGKQLNNTISRKMHNYEHNIEDLEEKDDRSNYERNEDLNFIRQQIGAKLNKLFANDHDEVNAFMEFINENQISIQEFNTVYPELLKNSDPNTATASYMIPKFQQLLDNYYSTGSTNGSGSLMKKIYNLIEKVYESGGINQKEADDMVDRMEASVQLNPSDMWIKEIQRKMNQSDKTDEEKIIEIDKMTHPVVSPIKKKLNDEIQLQRVSFENWDMAKSKEILSKSFTRPQLQEILRMNNNTNFKSTESKAKLVDKVWDLK